MLILLVGLAFLIVAFSSYAFAYQINGINRVIELTPISLFEASVLYDVNSEEPNLIFDKNIIKERLRNYYSHELRKFSIEYECEIYFFNKIDESMCIEEECDAVEITFNATLIYNYQYKRILTYEVFKNDYGS